MKAYRRAAVASTFSPTHEAVLAEADAFAKRIGADLHILHASGRTEEKARRFDETLERLGRKAEVHWVPGDVPAEALLEGVRGLNCDLLIAGALEKDTLAEERAFTGSVARRFLMEAPCDVLLIPRPEIPPRPIATALVAIEPGQDILDFLRELSTVLDLKSLVAAVAETPFAAAIAASRGESSLNARDWADTLAESLADGGIDCEPCIINSNTGFGLCEAAQGFGSDLMVVRARRENGRTAFPPHLDWLRQVIPTRVLLCGD